MGPILLILGLPFLGTLIGSLSVFFVRKQPSEKATKSIMGFAAGIMCSACFWSLLLPSVELAQNLGFWAFVPCSIGIGIGVAFLLSLDHLIPHMHISTHEIEGMRTSFSKAFMLILAITLHSIPEGIAVGSNLSAWMYSPESISYQSALALAIAMGLHNIPESAVVAIPLKAEGVSSWKAFWWSLMTGAVEPLFAVVTIFLTDQIVPYLPWLFGFAAGAMLFVIVEDLVPEMSVGKHSHAGVIFFMIGFVLMIFLETSLA